MERWKGWTRRRKIVLLSGVAALVVGVGVALAIWTVQGTGNTTAKAGKLQQLSLEAVPSTGPVLFPGKTGGISFTVGNPNTAMTITGLVPAGPVVSSDPNNCPSNNVTVTPGLGSGLSIPLAPGGTVPITIPNGASMSVDAPTQCQDKTFTIPVTITAVPAGP